MLTSTSYYFLKVCRSKLDKAKCENALQSAEALNLFTNCPFQNKKASREHWMNLGRQEAQEH
jgi:hypothetical protein